jgi:PAS domain S-box-containing protein
VTPDREPLRDRKSRHRTPARLMQSLPEDEERRRPPGDGAREFALFVLDAEGCIRSWNLGAERATGLDAAGVIGRPLAALYSEEAAAAGEPARNLETALQWGYFEGESWQEGRDGERSRINLIITALRDREQRHTGYAVAMRDMTDRPLLAATLRRRNEVLLQESEERFARFAENLPGLAWIKDLHGCYVYVNEAAARAFGGTREAITGRHDADLFSPESALPFIENDRRALAGGTGIQVVEFLRDPQGVLRHSIVSKFPIRDAEGRPRLLGGIAIDITDRVQAEEALRRADRRKDEFLATLSHELRNPLAPIRNALHILRQTGPGEAADRVHEMLDHQLARLIRLVDDLLEVSRISGGRLDLRKEPVDLGSVVQSAIETSAPLIEAASHRLTVSLPDRPLVVDADPIRLGQVLSNLLSNAAKYTADGGHIQVAVRRDGASAVITVRDDGIGIPGEMHSRVFDMFAQVDRTLKRAQGGLGIGLALARTLVELHGGRIEVKSAGLNQGSEFTVRIPAPEGRQRSRDPVPHTRIRATSMTPHNILVVDDSRDGADSLGMVLKMMGAEPRVVYDGPSALAAIRDQLPATVLLDIGMPGMDGYEVAAEIRKNPACAKMRMIALTGWGSEEERRRSREAGFDDHWVKPVDPAKLRELLDAGTPAGE